MTRQSVHQARFNLAQADRYPTWYEHLSKVEAAVAAQDHAIDQWCSLGWELDDDGWHAPGNWDEVWGDPNHDLYFLSDTQFTELRNQINGL